MNDDMESGYASPKPATKSVSWASSVTSSTESSEQQEIIALRHELKEVMKENLEYAIRTTYVNYYGPNYNTPIDIEVDCLT